VVAGQGDAGLVAHSIRFSMAKVPAHSAGAKHWPFNRHWELAPHTFWAVCWLRRWWRLWRRAQSGCHWRR